MATIFIFLYIGVD